MKEYLLSIVEKYKTIIKNTGYLSIIEVIRLLLPFIAMSYLIKTVGVENYGLAVFSQAVNYYFIIFINWGLEVSAVKDVSVNRDCNDKLGRIAGSVLGVKAILFAVSLLVLTVLLFTVPLFSEHKILFFFAFLTCFAEAIFPVWLFQGLEKMKYITICKVASIVFYTGTVFAFIREPSDYELIVLLQSLGNILSSVISVVLIYKVLKLRLLIPSKEELLITFRSGTAFFMSRLSVVINNTTAKTVSGFVFNMELVSAFDVAQKIAQAAIVPLQMINNATYPHIAKTLDKGFLKKFGMVMMAIAFMLAVGVYVMAPWLVTLFTGGKLLVSVTILRILCMWVLLNGATYFLGTTSLVSFGHPKEFNLSVIFSSLVLIAMYGICYWLEVFNIENFALALVVSEVFIVAFRFYYCVKYDILQFDLK